MAFPENEELDEPLRLFITALKDDTNVTVSVPLLEVPEEERTLNENEATEITLWGFLQTVGTAVESKGILIEATSEVVVHALSFQSSFCGSYQVIPVDAIGLDYYVVSHESEYSQLTIVAAEDDTTVTITFTSSSVIEVELDGVTYDSSTPVVKSLNSYETLQIQSTSSVSLTGTKVSATKAVSLLSGVRNLQGIGANAGKDHTVQNMMPSQAFGTTFGVVPPTVQGVGPTFYIDIVARDPLTVVTVNNGVYNLDNPGNTASISIDDDAFVGIKSNNPILVTQLVASETDDSVSPALITIPPAQQWRSKYVFFVPKPTNEDYTVYLMLVIAAGEDTSLRLDGEDKTGDLLWESISNTDPQLWGTAVDVSEDNVHTVEHLDGEKFAAYVYGHDYLGCAFGYVAGMCLDDITSVRYFILN